MIGKITNNLRDGNATVIPPECSRELQGLVHHENRKCCGFGNSHYKNKIMIIHNEKARTTMIITVNGAILARTSNEILISYAYNNR